LFRIAKISTLNLAFLSRIPEQPPHGNRFSKIKLKQINSRTGTEAGKY
jgi:hypothetical protein